jgi:protein ATS1
MTKFRVYCCGSNGKYQLGTGSDEDLDELECVFTSEVLISKISSGGNHTLMILSNGDLYATGDNSQGQCGLEDDIIQNFTIVPQIKGSPWVDCSCGYEFSIMVNAQGQMFASGFGPKGELGLGEGVSRARMSVVPFKGLNLQEIKSCVDHTVIRSNDMLYGWGNGRNGKLGGNENKVWIPTPITEAQNFALARDFTVIDHNGLDIVGKDKFDIAIVLPREYGSFRTMWSSFHYQDPYGKIRSLGNNSHGQMIPVHKGNPRLWTVGSEHGIVVYDDTVQCWGWGEHGNCGAMREGSVTFDYMNALKAFTGETIVKVHGGCATTWVVTELS